MSAPDAFSARACHSHLVSGRVHAGGPLHGVRRRQVRATQAPSLEVSRDPGLVQLLRNRNRLPRTE